jgi:hypothetical protein
MNVIVRAACVTICLLSFGCSSERAKRSAYESLQNREQMDCRKNPGSQCPEKQNYDDYQRSLNKRSEPGK